MSSIFNATECEVIIPEEVPFLNGFYYYPENKNIAVSKEGKIFSILTKNYIQPYLDDKRNNIQKGMDRYKVNIKITETANNRKTFLLSRIIARTFIGRHPTISYLSYNQLEVNHINLNHQDDSPDNLEWCTKLQNMQHSVINNKDNKKYVSILLKHIVTGEILSFVSISECARFLNMKNITLRESLLLGRNKYHRYGYYIAKYETDEDWPIITLQNIISGDGNNTALMVFNLITKEVREFESITEWVAIGEFSRKVIYGYLLVKNYRIYRLNEFVVLKKGDIFENLPIMDSDNYLTFFYIKNLVTGEKKEFKNSQELGIFLGLTVTTITSLLRNEYHVYQRFNEWILKRRNELWPALNMNSPIFRFGKILDATYIKVTELATNKSTIHDTLTDTVNYYSWNLASLSCRLKASNNKLQMRKYIVERLRYS